MWEAQSVAGVAAAFVRAKKPRRGSIVDGSDAPMKIRCRGVRVLAQDNLLWALDVR